MTYGRLAIYALMMLVSGAVLFSGGAALPGPTTREGVSESMESVIGRYLSLGSEYRRDMEKRFLEEARRRLGQLSKNYQRRRRVLEPRIRNARQAAIKVMREFLRRHPNHKVFTPEVELRLAELEYEEADDRYVAAEEEYERRHELWERGKIPEEPHPPTKDLSRAIRLYWDIVERFPDYKLAEAARYYLAICYYDTMEMGKYARNLELLLQQSPKTRFRGAALMRLGLYHFDNGEWDKALGYYQKVVDSKDPKYYEMALYMLAWSYFQKSDYPRAITTFKRLLAYIDETPGQKGLGAQLRSDAVEYLGVSLADDDWDGDGLPDPDATVERALGYLSEGKPFEREVLETYADTLYSEHEAAKYPMAIKAYRAVIRQNPLHPDNPLIKEKIIAAYDEMRDEAHMIAERVELIKKFGPGSRWYEANGNRPEVLARVHRQVELALILAAKFHHRRAQELEAQHQNTRDPQYGMAAVQEYRTAAQAYRKYLEKFPRNSQAYELTYYLADCLYYSFEFEKAARTYERVRDWQGRDEYKEGAAFLAIESLEKQAMKLAKEGKIPQQQVMGEVVPAKEEKAPGGEKKQKVSSKPIPPLTKEWVAAADKYLGLGLKRPDNPDFVPNLAYRVAVEFYKYRHFEEARKRFLEVIKKFPKHPVASYAAMNIINTYRLENDWKNIEIWAKKLEEMHLGKPEERAKLQEQVRLFKLGAKFKEAEKLFDQKKYIAAAKEFIAVVNQDPRQKFADKALFNAAVAYQNAKHYDSAVKAFERLVADYPQSKFIEQALLAIAENARKFYDFRKAVLTFSALRKRFPQSKNAAYALYSASVLLEADGRFLEAARSYEEFASSYPGDEKAGQLLYRAIKIYHKLRRWEDVIRVSKRFLKDYGGSPDMSSKVVEVLSNLADVYLIMGDKRRWQRTLGQVIDEFQKRGLEPDTPDAYYPARAQFLLTEEIYKDYKKIEFKGSLRQQGRLVEKKKSLLAKLEDEYSKILPYKSLEWTAAAYYRMAEIHELFSNALYNAEVPPMSEEEMAIYQTQLEDASSQYLQTAQTRYAELLERARQFKIANKWVDMARDAMNRFDPHRYPLIKKTRRVLDQRVRWMPRLVEGL